MIIVSGGEWIITDGLQAFAEFVVPIQRVIENRLDDVQFGILRRVMVGTHDRLFVEPLVE